MRQRLSAQQAYEMGLISDEMRRAMQRTVWPSRGRSHPKRSPRRPGQVLGENAPQHILFDALNHTWPSRFTWELPIKPPGAGRAYRLDMASPGDKLCIEMDGWQFHGKYKRDFQRDRVRQNRLCLDGWRILRYFPRQVHSDINAIIDEVARALDDY